MKLHIHGYNADNSVMMKNTNSLFILLKIIIWYELCCSFIK